MEPLLSLKQYRHNFSTVGELRDLQQVSHIGFGTVKIGRNQKVKNKSPDGFSLPSIKEVDALLSLAIEHGINFIDTAPAYGTSEEVLGQVIGTRRKQLFLSTKVGEEFDGSESSYHFDTKHTITSIERSLKRLRTEYLDSVLVHCPREDLRVLTSTPILNDLKDLKKQGKIKSFGASTNSIEGGLYAAEHCDSVMVSYNILYTKEAEVLRKADSLGKGLIIKKGLMQGHLDKLKSHHPIKDCLKGIFTQFPRSTVVLGTLNPKHLTSNIKCGIEALSEI